MLPLTVANADALIIALRAIQREVGEHFPVYGAQVGGSVRRIEAQLLPRLARRFEHPIVPIIRGYLAANPKGF